MKRKSNSVAIAQFQTVFRQFRRILDLNNKILEKISDLKRISDSSYNIDRFYLKNNISWLIERGRQVIYHLNSMTADQFYPLYDQFTITCDHLTDILDGGAGPYGGYNILAGEVLHRDLVHLSGRKGANLGETKNTLRIQTPPVFVLSSTGYRYFMRSNDLFSRINKICLEVKDPEVLEARINTLFVEAVIPADLNSSIKENVGILKKQMHGQDKFAIRSSAVGEDGQKSYAGQFLTLLNVKERDVPAACVKIMASRFSKSLQKYVGPLVEAERIPMAVVVQPMISAQASGVMYTRNPNKPEDEALVVSAVSGTGQTIASGRLSGDRYVLSRKDPFPLMSCSISPHSQVNQELLQDPTEPLHGWLRRGSGIVGSDFLKKISEIGLRIEKHFEWPQDIEWCLDTEGHIWILQVRPLPLQRRTKRQCPDNIINALAEMPILMQNKGHICQLGMAGGKVVHVVEETPVESFPVGAVAVCRYASPRLAAIVERASAVITEVGSPTGHLAIITREYKTPAIFGADYALSLLPQGAEVVVDVAKRIVYSGHVVLPLGLSQGRTEIHTGNPVAGILRRLLRLIAPLNLTDPGSSEFSMDNCQTIHDFLRFSHEKAAAELINFHSSIKIPREINAPIMRGNLPLTIKVIDIGGGLKDNFSRRVDIDSINCLPFKSFISGVQKKEMWSQGAVSFRSESFFRKLTGPLNRLIKHPSYSGDSIAVISNNYFNASLRFGYHFNMIDCYLSNEPDENYIYFRIVGGSADRGRRIRRATLINQILTGLHFKVDQKGDLIVAKVKMLARAHLENILVHIGELVVYTRKLDVQMEDEEVMDKYLLDFLERIRAIKELKGL